MCGHGVQQRTRIHEPGRRWFVILHCVACVLTVIGMCILCDGENP